jgi:TctA family transporter
MHEIIVGIGNIFTPWPLFFTVLGTILGIVVGAIPGLTGAMLIALTLPLTYYMSAVNALILLISMYVGSISGGQISSILLGMPGGKTGSGPGTRYWRIFFRGACFLDFSRAPGPTSFGDRCSVWPV